MPIESEPGRGNSEAPRGVLCVVCEHLNPPGKQVCDECQSDLYVACPSCGRRNERVYTRCSKCRRPLQRSRWGRWLEGLLGKKPFCWLMACAIHVLNFFVLWNVTTFDGLELSSLRISNLFRASDVGFRILAATPPHQLCDRFAARSVTFAPC
ncbi:MAG: hypothetical protein HY735_18040 [Verrucomicrobia bacterium]|nr:hypothetical protein [Verrucomicrobiota bacterium]